jgi:hypothetical protein
MPQNNMPDSPLAGFNFDGVDGADMSFDDLFGPPGDGQQPVTQTTAPTGEQPVAPVVPQVQTPAQPEFVIDTQTSKYKTLEDATKGVQEKDALIENLRQEFIARTGVDPVTRRPVNLSPAQKEVNYLNDPAQFTKDLRSAVEKGDDVAYAQAQIKLMNDTLQPIAPLITGYAKQNAVDSVSKEITEFQAFRNSGDFSTVMDKNPILGQAIQTAEGDYRLHGQLPELYRVAYWASQGLRTPDLVKAAQTQAAQAAAAVQAQQPVRSPMQSSTLAPPTGGGARPTVSTSEGRKALIAQFEAGGGMDVKF